MCDIQYSDHIDSFSRKVETLSGPEDTIASESGVKWLLSSSLDNVEHFFKLDHQSPVLGL